LPGKKKEIMQDGRIDVIMKVFAGKQVCKKIPKILSEKGRL
jgi:hypothetical protein